MTQLTDSFTWMTKNLHRHKDQRFIEHHPTFNSHNTTTKSNQKLPKVFMVLFGIYNYLRHNPFYNE